MTLRRQQQPLRLASILTAGALCLIGLGLMAGTTTPPTSSVLGTTVTNPERLAFATTEDAEVQMFVDRINELRAERGIDPLSPDPELELTATAWAAHMSQTQDLEHAEDLSLGVSTDWRKLGENVGVAPEAQLDELFEAFVASPTHLANLVDPTFDKIGIGVVHANGKLWMAQRFMDISPEDLGVELG